MSNLFTNLFLRNGDKPSPAILQPRLPSLFESPNRIEELPDMMSDQGETGSLHQSPERVAFSPQVETIHVPISVSPSLDKSTIEHSEDDHRFISRVPSTDNFPPLVQQESTHSRVIHAPTEPGGYDQSLKSVDSIRAETIRSQEEYSVMPKPQITNQQTGEDTMERYVKPRVNSVEPLYKNAQQAESKKPAAFGNLHNPPHVIHSRENMVGVEPPVVQIHIGRIEVRTVLPPPVQPVTKAAPAQPRLTLDDYLRQREGRR